MSAYIPFTKVDLFCGAGLESAASQLAMADLGIKPDTAHAINHWDLAVQVHGKNFPYVRVHQEDITKVTAATFGLDDGRKMVLWASPSCVHFSRARGGKPRDDQQRSHADEVIDRWIVPARPGIVFVENVPDFATWGPLHEDHSPGCSDNDGLEDCPKCVKGCHYGQPIKARKGEFFRAFVAKLQDLGYQVDWKILCAADFGDPTTRQRFFLQAVLDDLPITWPEPSHRDPRKPVGLFDPELPAWRTASECIDWSLKVPSIFGRKKPLAENTLRRIAAGIDRYVLHGTPYIVQTPTGPLAASLIQYHTETTGSARVSNLGEPIPTLDTSNRYALVAAFLAKHFTGVVGTGLDQPIGTVTGIDHHSLVTAFMVNTRNGEREGQSPRCLDLERPMLTITAEGSQGAVVAAFLTSYYGTTNISPMTDPLDTVTTKDRHGLVTVVIDGQTYAIVDIGMRMLEPHELAKAMSVPDWYRFERMDGLPLTKADKVKMIGNGVPVETARALIRNALAARLADCRGVA